MMLNDIIGQDRAKSRINFHINAFASGEPVPNLFFIAPRGTGKTSLATAAGLELKKVSGGAKRFLVVNCASIKGLKQFFNGIVMPHINDRDVTILFDEASELPLDVTMGLLTMINPNSNNRNTYSYDDYTVDIDLKRQTFMFATTEGQSIFHALLSRCRRIDLEPYTYDQLSKIVQLNCKDVQFDSTILANIAPVLRGEPRQATLLANDIKNYLAPLHKNTFDAQDWTNLCSQLDILPFGLTRLELQVLRVLEKSKDVSLTRLGATLGMTPEAVRKDLELFLMRRGFLEIKQTGRNITALGLGYLKALGNNV
jgi:Holliday junction resolvasome RuvABC ATP-dependent DNA helicase subunit